jgi:hypothetical protein
MNLRAALVLSAILLVGTLPTASFARHSAASSTTPVSATAVITWNAIA